MNSWLIEGDFNRLDAMTQEGIRMMEETGKGMCAPGFVKDYIKENDWEINMLDYHEYLFNSAEGYEMYTEGMSPAPMDFWEWQMMAAPYMPGIENWGEMWFEGECMGEGRGGRGGDMDNDDFINWGEDRDRMIMTGADGSKIYIEMGAAKLAASVAALAAVALY